MPSRDSIQGPIHDGANIGVHGDELTLPMLALSKVRCQCVPRAERNETHRRQTLWITCASLQQPVGELVHGSITTKYSNSIDPSQILLQSNFTGMIDILSLALNYLNTTCGKSRADQVSHHLLRRLLASMWVVDHQDLLHSSAPVSGIGLLCDQWCNTQGWGRWADASSHSRRNKVANSGTSNDKCAKAQGQVCHHPTLPKV
mmetsp:Transcript_24142/g.44340  ORF Transcript_24142/g.44340 Transcript_24142/m.44340 type:complete len:202 (+) Transcript_24142:2302-2907(+)